MAKRIRVFHSNDKLFFSIGDRTVKVSESMPLEDAQRIAAQYPGKYLAVDEEPPVEPIPPVPTTAKTRKRKRVPTPEKVNQTT